MTPKELIQKIRILDFSWLNNNDFTDEVYSDPEVLLQLAFFYDDFLYTKELPLNIGFKAFLKLGYSPLKKAFSSDSLIRLKVFRRRISKETLKKEAQPKASFLPKGTITSLDDEPFFRTLNIDAMHRKHKK